MSTDFVIESFSGTAQGQKRSSNDDFVGAFEPTDLQEMRSSGSLYIIADGMGSGTVSGEKVSQYAVKRVLKEFYSDTNPDLGARLTRSIRVASNDICDHVEYGGQSAQMATTMVAALVRNGVLKVASVGDSRAYLISNSQARQITQDHTVAGDLIRRGAVSEVEAVHLKGGQRLAKALGAERDVQADLFEDIPLRAGDTVLLCSNGLSYYASSRDIAYLADRGDPKDIVKHCIQFARRHGRGDDVSVIAIRAREPSGESVTASTASNLEEGSARQSSPTPGSSTTRAKESPLPRKRSGTRPPWILLGALVLGAVFVALCAIIAPGIYRSSRLSLEATPAADVNQSGMELVTAIPQQGDSEPCVAVADTDVAVFTEPNAAAQSIGRMNSGQSAAVTGRSEDDVWWQINYPPDSGNRGWVQRAQITVTGNCGLTSDAGQTDVESNTAAATPSVQESNTPESTELTLTPSATVLPLAGCVYVVQESDAAGLAVILSRFSLPRNNELVYREFFSLEQGQGGEVVLIQLQRGASGSPSIRVGQTLLVPVQTEEQCVNGDGEWREPLTF